MKITEKSARISAVIFWPLVLTVFASLLVSACTSPSGESASSKCSVKDAKDDTFIARVWIDARGQVIRYESDQKGDQAKAVMRAALLGCKMSPPPAGMPMPIIMRMHRSPKEQNN